MKENNNFFHSGEILFLKWHMSLYITYYAGSSPYIPLFVKFINTLNILPTLVSSIAREASKLVPLGNTLSTKDEIKISVEMSMEQSLPKINSKCSMLFLQCLQLLKSSPFLLTGHTKVRQLANSWSSAFSANTLKKWSISLTLIHF